MAKMNRLQKDALALYTCGILTKYSDMEETLKEHGTPKKLIKKMNKAFDLIFEVNQYCVQKHKKS